jgi:hypothetical protein
MLTQSPSGLDEIIHTFGNPDDSQFEARNVVSFNLEAKKFPHGSSEHFPDEIVTICRNAGFFYGVDFQGRKAPMHFQLATNF